MLELLNLIIAIISLLATVIIAVVTFSINKTVNDNEEFKNYFHITELALLAVTLVDEKNIGVAKENFENHLENLCEFANFKNNKKIDVIISNSYGDIIERTISEKDEARENMVNFVRRTK